MLRKRMIGGLTATAILLTSMSLPSGAAVYAETAFAKDAQEIVEEITFGWNLGNSLDCYSSTTIQMGSLSSETSWGNPSTTQEMIDAICDTGINAIRIPVTWYNHMDPVTYEIDAAWMARVEEVVQYVLNDDMYCILNVHHDTGENGWLKASSTDLEQKEEMFTAIWTQVSATFADYGDKLLFEGFNEILNDSNEWVNPDSEAVAITNELNQIFVDTVRQSGGNNDVRNLICNTYCAGGNQAVTKDFVLPTDSVENRLIVAAHIYQPFYFTSESYPTVTTWDSASIDTYVGNMYHQFVEAGVPVIISEFGCVSKDNASQRQEWAKYYVDLCTSYGIKCFWWDDGTQYKLFNRRMLKITEPELLSIMLAAAKGETYTPDTSVAGDVNADGSFTIADAELLQQWLLGMEVSLADLQAADVCADQQWNIFDLCRMKQLLLEQKNLCASLEAWTVWIDTSTGAVGEMSYEENGVTLRVENGGTYAWNAQIYYGNIALEQGTTYQLSFDYWADSAQTTSMNVMQGHDDYLPYNSSTLHWTTEKQHFEKTFTFTSATDNLCRVGFNLGGDGVTVPFQATVTNLKLVALS